MRLALRCSFALALLAGSLAGCGGPPDPGPADASCDFCDSPVYLVARIVTETGVTGEAGRTERTTWH